MWERKTFCEKNWQIYGLDLDAYAGRYQQISVQRRTGHSVSKCWSLPLPGMSVLKTQKFKDPPGGSPWRLNVPPFHARTSEYISVYAAPADRASNYPVPAFPIHSASLSPTVIDISVFASQFANQK